RAPPSTPLPPYTTLFRSDPHGWTVYHGNPAGTGVAPGVTSVDTRTRAWTSPALDGSIYGEPLVFAGRVYVATENDTVYALSAAKIGRAHVWTPVTDQVRM